MSGDSYSSLISFNYFNTFTKYTYTIIHKYNIIYSVHVFEYFYA